MNKRVCHISYNHGAFDDRIYWKELIALKEAGYECIHICVGNEFKDFFSEEGIRIIQVKKQENKAGIWLSRFKFLLSKRATTINTILEHALALKANVYHYHDLQLNALVKPLKKQSWKPALIYDSHEAYHLLLLEGKKPNILKTLLVKAISIWEINNAKHCDYIITTDNYTKNYFSKKISSLPSSVLYNYSYFNQHNNTTVEKPFTFIYTGLMNKERGLFEMANLILQLKDSFPDVKLLLVGSFEDESIERDFKVFIELNNLKNHIQIIQQVDFKKISDYYHGSKIGLGLFHKTPKYKTFIPIKLFEYMAFGLPVIFSNHGPSSEIIEQEKCGILADVKNLNSIRNAAEDILTNEGLYTELSANGKKAANEKFSWEKEKSKLLNIYAQLFNG